MFFAAAATSSSVPEPEARIAGRLAVFGDVVAPVVGVGRLGAEAAFQGVEIGERGQQVVHGDVLRRRDELGLALLPELITGSAFRSQSAQLGRQQDLTSFASPPSVCS